MHRVHTEVHSLMCRCISGYPGLEHTSIPGVELACTFQLQILVYARVERVKATV
jgi:hypothetical protein